MFVCLFWTVMLTISLRERFNKARAHLLVFMIVASILYWGHCIFFNHDKALVPLADTLYSVANLSVYPLYYLYICSLTKRDYTIHLQWMWLTPAIFSGIIIGSLYLMMDATQTERFIENYLYRNHFEGISNLEEIQAITHSLCKSIFALQIIPVFVFGWHHIKKFNETVANTYADTENKVLTPLHSLLIFFAVTSIASFVCNLIGRYRFADSIILLAIPSILFSILLFALGYVGYKQEFSITDIEKDEVEADESMVEQANMQELRQRIEQLMHDEQLFRQHNMKIIDLVHRLGTNRNYIYRAINLDMGISFTEYVNRMRIDYAIELINQQPTRLISEIGEEAGFSSPTSFYRNFKLYKGISPKEYQQNVNLP